MRFTIPILSVGLTGEGMSLSWYNRLFSTAVNPRNGFKITPARKALESSGPDVSARSKTLPNLDCSAFDSSNWIASSCSIVENLVFIKIKTINPPFGINDNYLYYLSIIKSYLSVLTHLGRWKKLSDWSISEVSGALNFIVGGRIFGMVIALHVSLIFLRQFNLFSCCSFLRSVSKIASIGSSFVSKFVNKEAVGSEVSLQIRYSSDVF